MYMQRDEVCPGECLGGEGAGGEAAMKNPCPILQDLPRPAAMSDEKHGFTEKGDTVTGVGGKRYP